MFLGSRHGDWDPRPAGAGGSELGSAFMGKNQQIYTPHSAGENSTTEWLANQSGLSMIVYRRFGFREQLSGSTADLSAYTSDQSAPVSGSRRCRGAH